MKKILICGMLLGLLSGVGLAQRGRPVGPMARPDVSIGSRAGTMPSPTGAINRTTSARTTIAPNSTTAARGVDATAAPIRDPLVGNKTTAAPSSTTASPSVGPTVAPIRDPLIGSSGGSKTPAPIATPPRVEHPQP